MSDPQTLPGDRRKARDDRLVTTLLLGRIVAPLGDTVCRIRNLSQGGAKIEIRAPLAVGDPVSVELRGTTLVPGTVAWVSGNTAGVAFSEPVERDTLLGHSGQGRFKQRSPRLEADCQAILRVAGHPHAARLLDIGQRGACVGGAGDLARDTSVRLEAAGLGHVAAVVRWSRPDAVGLFFPEPIPFVTLSAWSQDGATRFSARG
ncbi:MULTISPECIES: PilZ domain-containing protein [unclassified Sphingomonas]|uniref:PilZ domain-containing protein n=1 Tax=unclassified Sphingomonas TaxID=196159 RepID=UPI001F5994AF|nr:MULTISPECIES: PilZ domain-containing protein [unclassified Sphingomonas]